MTRKRRTEFLVFGAPQIGEEEIQEVLDTLRSGWIGTGPRVAALESAFAEYKSAPFAIAVNSCTAALQLSLRAAGIGPGDEVVTTALTFCATVNAIIHSGARPVLADVDGLTMNLDPEKVAEVLTARTKAILPVHFGGRPCAMDDLCDLAAAAGLTVIEDCAHAIESEYRGRKTGTFGDFGCFSFYVTKNLMTGEGGMILTRRGEDAARLKRLALHGLSSDAWKRFSDDGFRHYYVVDCGFKHNMMDLQAALGIHQLGRIEENWRRRQAIWERYEETLSDLPITLPQPPQSDTRHAYHLYTIRVDERRARLGRDDLLQALTAEKIGVGVHYLSIPEHPYYQQQYGWQPEDYPQAMAIGRQTVSLPLSPRLSDDDVEDVIAALHRILVPSSAGS